MRDYLSNALSTMYWNVSKEQNLQGKPASTLLSMKGNTEKKWGVVLRARNPNISEGALRVKSTLTWEH